ncbi:MAG: hypothetical protein R2911_46315, partial [Caldilineaceae bacterium]
DPLAAFAHNLPTSAQQRDIWQPLLLIAALLFPLDVALRRVLFGKQPLQRTMSWMRQRLPERAAPAEQPAVLGPLHQARERARARQSRQREPSAGGEQSSSPAAPDRQPDLQVEEPVAEDDNTLARLRQAKRRAGRRDGS